MKKTAVFIATGIFFLLSLVVQAQTANISEIQTRLITYPFSDPDPVPEFGKIYPYFRFEGYAVEGKEQSWKMVELENDFIKLWITPEIGGKIWGAVEKATGKEFIYYNHAVKFRDVGMRGPWTSGGLEMNFGVIGHAPTCSTPVDYYIRENEDGSVSCFVGAIDLPSHTRWYVETNLQEDKAYFTTRSVWNNPTSLEQSYYHWMNLGVKTAGNLEYIFPGNYYLGHDGNPSLWPTDKQGNKINFYENNNFGSYKSYHVSGELTDFYGTYWHDDDFGFVHYSPYDQKPGKKIWIWGLSDQGMIWEDLLTDSDGQYTEIQSGRLFNQAAANSTLTPFKHREFTPATTDEWTEFWFPVKHTQGLKAALPAGSVNLLRNENKMDLYFCANQKAEGILRVKDRNGVVFEKQMETDPMQVVHESFPYNGETDHLSVWLNETQLFDANRQKYQTKRPVEAPAGFDWETAYGHFLKGKEQERQRNYLTADQEYKKSLEKEPTFVPALTGMAAILYRRADYGNSLKYALKALSIDTYDANANLYYALSGLALSDTISAIDGFSIASASVTARSAAMNGLASIFMNNGEYEKALGYANKSLVANAMGKDAIQLKALCLRKLELEDEAASLLEEMEKEDPLNHFIRFERFLINPSDENRKNVSVFITNDLPHESYLEYALWYYKNGQAQDAIKILELSPREHPVILLWKGYLAHLSGDEHGASANLDRALEMSTDFVFPFRRETLLPLEWAGSLSGNWKLKYYTGLVWLGLGVHETGKQYWIACGNEPDIFPFYIARSRLFEADSQEASSDVERALQLADNDWRAGFYASRFYMNTGNNDRAEELASDFYQKYPKNYYLALQRAKLLQMNGNYPESIKVLENTVVLPNEGATEGRRIWRNANIGRALDLYETKKYRKTLEYVQDAKKWPFNLGVGRPYFVDERLEDFISMQCFIQLNKDSEAEKMQQNIINAPGKQEFPTGPNDLLTALQLKEQGKVADADQLMAELQKKNPGSMIAEWCTAIYSGDFEKARMLEQEIDSNDQNFLFIKRIFDEMH